MHLSTIIIDLVAIPRASSFSDIKKKKSVFILLCQYLGGLCELDHQFLDPSWHVLCLPNWRGGCTEVVERFWRFRGVREGLSNTSATFPRQVVKVFGPLTYSHTGLSRNICTMSSILERWLYRSCRDVLKVQSGSWGSLKHVCNLPQAGCQGLWPLWHISTPPFYLGAGMVVWLGPFLMYSG